MDIQTLLLSFEGRVNRKRYWLTIIGLTVAVIILIVIAGLLDSVLGTQINFGDTTVNTLNGPVAVPIQIGVLTLIVYVLQLWPGLALAVKRCHDRGRSGWFLLLQFIPLVNIWVVIEILFLKGTTGPNRFGPDPLMPNAQAIGQVFS